MFESRPQSSYLFTKETIVLTVLRQINRSVLDIGVYRPVMCLQEKLDKESVKHGMKALIKQIKMPTLPVLAWLSN